MNKQYKVGSKYLKKNNQNILTDCTNYAMYYERDVNFRILKELEHNRYLCSILNTTDIFTAGEYWLYDCIEVIQKTQKHLPEWMLSR